MPSHNSAPVALASFTLWDMSHVAVLLADLFINLLPCEKRKIKHAPVGFMINDQLNWDTNTSYPLAMDNASMRLLHKLVDFGVPQENLVNIYILIHPIYYRKIGSSMAQLTHTG